MMVQESTANLDDLMLGNVGEEVSESDEQFAVRLAAAQAKLAKIAKDEGQAKNFDDKLAKIIPRLSPHTLKLVVFLIDHDIPSLTVLAIIALESDEAAKICHGEFYKFISEPADFSTVKLAKKLEEKMSFWWTFILAANQISMTTKLEELKKNASFTEFFSLEIIEMVKRFIVINKVEEFNKLALEKALEKYQKDLF
ncbi:hypothetical protein K9M41_01990 [Candidatus Gracilibacteria bacterium]|nr:hypothetical protein [Candidatus Gracilibacteria bacterium]